MDKLCPYQQFEEALMILFENLVFKNAAALFQYIVSISINIVLLMTVCFLSLINGYFI